MKNQTIANLAACLLIVLWVYTGLSKLLDLNTFKNAMLNQVFPVAWVPLIIYTIPTAELATAALLIPNKTKLVGFISSTLLMLVFTTYIALVVGNVFNRTPCSCGGILNALGWVNHLIFNSIYVIISMAGTITQYRIHKKEATT